MLPRYLLFPTSLCPERKTSKHPIKGSQGFPFFIFAFVPQLYPRHPKRCATGDREKHSSANTPSRFSVNDLINPSAYARSTVWYGIAVDKTPSEWKHEPFSTPAVLLHHCIPFRCAIAHEDASATHERRVDRRLLLRLRALW